MKNIRKVLSLILALMLLLSLAACASGGASETPPKYDVLFSKYGAKQEEVLKALDLSELKPSEIKGLESSSTKDTGLDVSFGGADFDLLLTFFEERLYGFRYHTKLEDSKKAAEVVASVVAKAKALYGKPVVWASDGDAEIRHIEELTQAELEELFKSGRGAVSDHYAIQKMTTEDALALLSVLGENSELNKYWKSGEMILTLSIEIRYGENGVTVILSYLPYPPNQMVLE